VNLRFLEAFVWVARLSSFKAAADKLCTTQAGISSRIATLEEQLGARLFERDRRSVTLTYQGTELLPIAERMLELQARLRGAVGHGAIAAGTVRIGVMETVVHTWLPTLLSRFSQQYPNVTIELHSDTTPHLRDELLRGRLDVAFTAESINEGSVENRPLANLAMRWIAAPGLPVLPGALGFAQLAGIPIISFRRESIVYRAIMRAAQEAGAERPLRISFFSSLAAMIALAKAGFGVAPLPLAVVRREIDRGELVALDVEPPLPPLPIFASQRAEPGSALNDALIALAATAAEESLGGDHAGGSAPALPLANVLSPALSPVTRKS
jgi:DNA-binding transcriptional LysR family regulator